MLPLMKNSPATEIWTLDVGHWEFDIHTHSLTHFEKQTLHEIWC